MESDGLPKCVKSAFGGGEGECRLQEVLSISIARILDPGIHSQHDEVLIQSRAPSALDCAPAESNHVFRSTRRRTGSLSLRRECNFNSRSDGMAYRAWPDCLVARAGSPTCSSTRRRPCNPLAWSACLSDGNHGGLHATRRRPRHPSTAAASGPEPTAAC